MNSRCSGRTAKILVLFIGVVAWAGKNAVAKTLRDIPDVDSSWNEANAVAHVKEDIGEFLEAYDKQRGKLKDIANDFTKVPLAQSGIRKVAQWGQAMAKLLEYLPTDQTSHGDEIYERLVETASWLASSYQEQFSYVEGKVIRGWPMKRREGNEYVVHEGFNFGNIAHTISLASKQAALRGDNDLAITLLKPVIESLYDNFLTLDTRQRKTDHMGRLARVPIESASDRRQRYLRVGDEEHCLDTPEQYNHGTAVAQAAIACHEAIEAIDWKSGAWPFPEVVAHRYIYKLFRYVRRNGEWMRRGMSLSPEPTGSNPRDNYPGQAGTRWYTWKYRDLDTCEEYKGTLKDRPQDISKGSKEMAFVTDFVRWAKKDVPFGQEVDPIDVSRIFTSPDIRALIVTFLNRLVRSYSGNAKHRFACDIHGTLDDDPEVYAPKSCEGRYEEDRPEYAASWLVLALAARNFPASTRLQCDAYRMVKAVLPLALKGNKQFYPHSFSKMSRTWTAELIVAKYYFYNYDYGLQQTCESQDDLMRVAAPASLPGPHSQHQQAPDSAQHSNNPSDDVQPRGGSVSYPKHAFQWRDKVSP